MAIDVTALLEQLEASGEIKTLLKALQTKRDVLKAEEAKIKAEKAEVEKARNEASEAFRLTIANIVGKALARADVTEATEGLKGCGFQTLRLYVQLDNVAAFDVRRGMLVAPKEPKANGGTRGPRTPFEWKGVTYATGAEAKRALLPDKANVAMSRQSIIDALTAAGK